jgi:hypothetical protein
MRPIIAIVLVLLICGCMPRRQGLTEPQSQPLRSKSIEVKWIDYKGGYTIGEYCIGGFIYYIIQGCCESGLTQALGADSKPVRCEE